MDKIKLDLDTMTDCELMLVKMINNAVEDNNPTRYQELTAYRQDYLERRQAEAETLEQEYHQLHPESDYISRDNYWTASDYADDFEDRYGERPSEYFNEY